MEPLFFNQLSKNQKLSDLEDLKEKKKKKVRNYLKMM